MTETVPTLTKAENRSSFVERCVKGMKEKKGITMEMYEKMGQEEKARMFKICNFAYDKQKSLELETDPMKLVKEAIKQTELMKDVISQNPKGIQKEKETEANAKPPNDLAVKAPEVNPEIGTPGLVSKTFIPCLAKGIISKTLDGREVKTLVITTTGEKEDRDGERMSGNVVDYVIQQHNKGNIPAFSNHGLDPITGQRLYKWQDMIGKWVKSYRDPENPMNALSHLRLNMAHPEAELLWRYAVEQEMPIAASIGGTVVEKTVEEVEE